jgi:hypothetical protein
MLARLEIVLRRLVFQLATDVFYMSCELSLFVACSCVQASIKQIEFWRMDFDKTLYAYVHKYIHLNFLKFSDYNQGHAEYQFC